MASATAMSTMDIADPSISTSQDSIATNGDSSDSTIDYWTALIRTNLATAELITAADSDSEDFSLGAIDEEIMNAPRRKSPRDALAREIAARLYPAPPDSLAPIIKYEKDVVMLRSM